MGACLPSQCSETALRSGTEALSSWLSSKILWLGNTLDIDLITNINLGVKFNVYSPAKWEESQAEDKQIFAYIVIVIIGVIVMLVLSSTVYIMMRQCMAS